MIKLELKLHGFVVEFKKPSLKFRVYMQKVQLFRPNGFVRDSQKGSVSCNIFLLLKLSVLLKDQFILFVSL